MIAYFCGVWPGNSAGHHSYRPNGEQWREGEPVTPWGSVEFGYAIMDGHVANLMPGHQGNPREPEGVRYWTQRGGWTLVSWWDRSADRRNASIAVFAFDAILTADQAEAEARSLFPGVFRRMDLHLGRTAAQQVLKEQVLAALQSAPYAKWQQVGEIIGVPK